MNRVIEVDGVGFDDLDKVFDLADVLDNEKELLEKFEPEVSKFLVKRDFFKGVFLQEYNKQFDELIKTLIKRELMGQFTSWTPEDLLLLTEDTDFLRMLAPTLFEQESYRKIKLN